MSSVDKFVKLNCSLLLMAMKFQENLEITMQGDAEMNSFKSGYIETLKKVIGGKAWNIHKIVKNQTIKLLLIQSKESKFEALNKKKLSLENAFKIWEGWGGYIWGPTKLLITTFLTFLSTSTINFSRENQHQQRIMKINNQQLKILNKSTT